MKNLLLLISSFSVLLFAACDKIAEEPADPEYETVGLVTEIEISDVEDNLYTDIVEVAFVARFHVPAGASGGPSLDTDGNDTRIMLRAPFGEQGARLTLPENPPQELLRNIVSEFPAGFEISDPDAKTISFVEIAVNMTDPSRVLDALRMGRSDENTHHELTYVYCDRDVTITGSATDWWNNPTTYDLTLRQGWNMVIEKTVYESSRIKTVNNLMPSGMRWTQDMWIGGL